jgi:hypothetical protein
MQHRNVGRLRVMASYGSGTTRSCTDVRIFSAFVRRWLLVTSVDIAGLRTEVWGWNVLEWDRDMPISRWSCQYFLVVVCPALCSIPTCCIRSFFRTSVCQKDLGFLGPEPALRVSRQDLRNKIGRWLGNQHRRRWQNLGSAQRQARELISDPCRGTRVRFLSFNGTQSRVVTGLLTGHNTLRRHLHLMGLTDSPLCRKCGAEEETFSVGVRPWPRLGMRTWAPFSWSERTLRAKTWAIWRFSKAAGLPWRTIVAQRACFF